MMRFTDGDISMRTAGRRGFTLLEVVIALALSLILLTAVTLSLDLFRRVATMSTDEIERGQLARAIFRQIELDLRSCTFQPPEAGVGAGASGSGSGSGSASASGSGTGTGTSQDAASATIDPALAYAAASMGIVGDARSIVINCVRPARNLGSLIDPTAVETAVPDSDLKSIVYFMSASGMEGLPGAAAEVLAGPATGAGVGLARIEGDQLAMQFADVTADVTTMASGATLLAQEVTVLGLRYFDGLAWFDSWDTTVYGRLPNAVEITLGFGEAPIPTDDASANAIAPVNAAYVFRHIVALPAAEPAALSSTAPL